MGVCRSGSTPTWSSWVSLMRLRWDMDVAWSLLELSRDEVRVYF